jgi:hypothetical protein
VERWVKIKIFYIKKMLDLNKCKYKCIDLYKSGWVHILYYPNEKENPLHYEILGKVAVWRIFADEDIINIYNKCKTEHNAYEFSKRIHELPVNKESLIEALTMTDIVKNRKKVWYDSML